MTNLLLPMLNGFDLFTNLSVDLKFLQDHMPLILTSLLNVVVLINPYMFFFEIWWENLSHFFRTMVVIVEACIH
jgi:hypothetical protein